MFNAPGSPITIVTPSSNSSSSSGGENGASIHMTKLRTESPHMDRLSRARITSPLQHSFPSVSIDDTLPTSESLTNTPTRPARSTKTESRRGRGMSRSSSVPLSIQNYGSQIRTNNNSTSPTSATLTPEMTFSNRHKESNVKHLTCYWWKEKGHCRFSDEECLYAHYDTGHYTEAPRQIVPGEPALAGRKLGRAMRDLALNPHRSSGSLSSMPGSRHTSRPGTPVFSTDYNPFPIVVGTGSPLASPIALSNNFGNDFDLARLNSDNQFLRNIIDQNGKEKGIMISTIENLQADNKGMKGELDGLRKAQEQLLKEREGLHKRIEELEQDLTQHLPMPPRNASNPFGTIGRGRVNAEKRFVGGFLTKE